MKPFAILPLLLLASPAFAQDGIDAAHRADQARTRQLNARAAAAVARRDNANAPALARHERAMADWRRRVAACRAGNHRACRAD